MWAISITYYYLVFFNSFILEQSIVLTLYLQFKEKYSRKKTQLILLRDVYIFNKQTNKKQGKKNLESISNFFQFQSPHRVQKASSCQCLVTAYFATVLQFYYSVCSTYKTTVTRSHDKAGKKVECPQFRHQRAQSPPHTLISC